MMNKFYYLPILALGLAKSEPIAVDPPVANPEAPMLQQGLYQGKVRLDYIRHGMTCANYVTLCRPDDVKWDDCLRDPRNVLNAEDPFLTNKGILESEEVAKKLEQPDIVFTSNMLSGIETALELYPKSTVYVGPWIMNLHMTKDKPQSQLNQLEILKKYCAPEKYNRVNYNLVNKLMGDYDMECLDEDYDSPRCQASWDNFLEWLSKDILDKYRTANNPDLPQSLKDKISKDLPLKIAIVGHGTQVKQQIFFDNDIKLPSNVGYFANFVLVDGSLQRIKEESDEYGDMWQYNENTDYALDGICDYEDNFENVDRCIARNYKEMNIITGKFKYNDGCPDGDEGYVESKLIYPQPSEMEIEEQTVQDPLPPALTIAEEADIPAVEARLNSADQNDEEDGKNTASSVASASMAVIFSLAAYFYI